MRRDKFNFSGILTFLVLGAAVCVLGAHVFGAVGVDGASCDTEGIWSRPVGTRSVAASGVTVSTPEELRNALEDPDSGDIITFGNNISVNEGTLNILRDVVINGGGHTLFGDPQAIAMSVGDSDFVGLGFVTIQNLTISGANAGILFKGVTSKNISLDIINCTLTNNEFGLALSEMGAGDAVLVSGSTIANNSVRGIDVGECYGSLSLVNSFISSNVGDGIYTPNVGFPSVTINNCEIRSNGGNGIILWGGGSLLVQYSTIANNNGNGISIGSGVTSAQIMNSTIANHTNGINVDGSGVLAEIMFSTIVNNTCGTRIENLARIEIASSISVGNTQDWDVVGGGSWTSRNYNVFGTYIGGGTDAYNVAYAQAFGANTLADNGGKTRTIKPINGSPAINRVPANEAFFGLTFDRDQRSDPVAYPRPGRDKTDKTMKDSGAFETQGGGGGGVWTGGINTTWYDSAPTASTYVLTSPDELAGLAKLVNDGTDSFHGKTVKLGNDMNLGGASNWTPIGAGSNAFIGTFDGGGHSITGLLVNLPTTDDVGLFGYCVGGAVIKNLNVYAGSVDGKDKVGGIIGLINGGRVENCTFSGVVTGVASVGGVVGQIGVGTAINCSNTGAVSGTGSSIGGVVGVSNSGAVTVTNCSNTGNVSGTGTGYYVGGVVGRNSGVVTSCSNTGNVYGMGNSIGGVAGYSDGAVTNCSNTGNVGGVGYIGGVVGYSNLGTVINCSNTGAVSGTDLYVGGVVGQSDSGTVMNCSNTGAVSGTASYIGGVVGFVRKYDGFNSIVANCSNSGTVSGTAPNIGGVVGLSGGTITNCEWLQGTAPSGVGSGSGTVTNVVSKDINSLTIAGILLRPAYSKIELNGTTTLTATLHPANATQPDLNVMWTFPALIAGSANGTSATITGRGTAGTATIRATKLTVLGGGTMSADATIDVGAAVTTTVSLNHTNLALKVDESAILTATTSPVGAAVDWKGSGSGTLDVEDIDAWNRRITPRSTGNHTMTVIARDSGASASCTIAVTSVDNPLPTPELSTYKLDLAPGKTGSITSPVDGTWETSNPAIAAISQTSATARLLSVSGKTVYVTAGTGFGAATITFTRGIDGKTADVAVFVSPQAIVDVNDVLASSDVGINILSPDEFPDVEAFVDTTAPTLLCYDPSDKPAGVVEVDISDTVRYPDTSNVFLPMLYTLGLTEGEIDAKCAQVGRDRIAGLFDNEQPSGDVIDAFFNVFVIQKEMLQGTRTGQLARLLGAGREQLVSPQSAISAQILTMGVDTVGRKIRLTFRYMVKDGTDAPMFDGKNIVIGDGLADRLIVDPLWTSVRKASGSVTPPDGGGGCNAGFLPMLMLMLMVFVLLTGVCYNEKEHRPE